MTDRPDIPERFSVRLTEAHAGATVVLKTSPDGSMVRYSDYEKARKQGAEEERERLREVVTRVLAEQNDGVLALAREAVDRDEAVRGRKLEDDAAVTRNCKQLILAALVDGDRSE